MTENILELKDLSVCYHSMDGPVWAVDHVDLKLGVGENLGLVGESGCGKTTIIKSIMQLLPRNSETHGEVLYKGDNLLKYSNAEIRKIRWNKISMVAQSAMNALDPVYRVGNQIVEAIREHRDMSKDEAWKQAERLFALVGVGKERLHDYPHQFSGGMRQRAVIAMALALSPDIIIADEPTTALDVIVQAQILNKIRELQREINNSMILVTHDISVVAETCDKIAVMYAGKIVEYGDVIEVFERPYHPYTMGLKNAFADVKGEQFELISIAGHPPNLLNPPEGCRFADRCPFATDLCREEAPESVEVADGHMVACHHIDRVEEIRTDALKSETWVKV